MCTEEAMTPFREMYPGIQPKKAEEYGKKTIDEFSGDCSNCDREDEKTQG
jgi:hypothetical protein